MWVFPALLSGKSSRTNMKELHVEFE